MQGVGGTRSKRKGEHAPRGLPLACPWGQRVRLKLRAQKLLPEFSV